MWSDVYPGNYHTLHCFKPAVEVAETALDLSSKQGKRTPWRMDGGSGAEALAAQVGYRDAYQEHTWLGEVLLFFVPFFGMAVGAAMGALSGHFKGYGIDDNFIKQVRDQVTPGTSALFLLTERAVVDRVVDERKGIDFKLVATNLSKEQEEELRTTFNA